MSSALGVMPERDRAVPAPAPLQPGQSIAFDRDPQLRELLHPDVVIRPGIDYLVCALMNVPRAEADGFMVMANQRSFTVRGIPALVLTRGVPTPGARAEAQIVPLLLDDTLRAPQPVPALAPEGQHDVVDEPEDTPPGPARQRR